MAESPCLGGQIVALQPLHDSIPMAVQYLLPCDCGNQTPVDASQAGSTILCSCGKKLDVPSLRAIRDLPLHAAESSQRKYQWNPAAGLIFVSGVLVALIAGGFAFFMHISAVQMVDFEPPAQEEITAWINEVDAAPPEDLIEIWNSAQHMGLGAHEESPFVQARMMSDNFAAYRNTSLIVFVSGLVFALSSIFLRRKV